MNKEQLKQEIQKIISHEKSGPKLSKTMREIIFLKTL